MASVQVKLFGSFAETMGNRLLWIKIESDITVGDLINKLDQMSDGRLNSLTNSTAEPKQDMKILVNGVDVDFLKGYKTILKDKDTIAITSPVVGG